jgi:RNA polymerase sigma-70 factor (ECF subfamily)
LPEQTNNLDLADLQAALARLTAPMREALVLVTLENLNHEAAVMNCRAGTVKSRVWRAREPRAQMLGYAMLKGEVLIERQNRLWAFLLGAAGYASLLLTL